MEEKKKRVCIVCDVETGGLCESENPVTEICMLSFNLDNLAVISEYSTFVKPYGGLEIDPIVFEKTTVTPSDVANGKDHKVVVKEMKEFFVKHDSGGKNGKPIIVGHNIIGFDRLFLEYIFLLNGEDIYDYISKEFIDTLPRSRELWPKEPKHDLNSACNRAGASLHGAHGAVADVRANYDLYCYMVKVQRAGLSKTTSEGVAKVVNGESTGRKYFNF